MGHDDERRGTTTSFTPRATANGRSLPSGKHRRRRRPFLAFSWWIDPYTR
jgi:hypothetical protein